jgi:hypothetical protein
MAELDSIQDLKKHPLDQGVIVNVVAFLSDTREQITFGTELDDYIGAVDGIHNANQGNHIGMLAGQMVQLDLALLEFELAVIQSGFVEGLDSIHHIGMDVNGSIDDTVSPYSQDSNEFQPVGQEKSQTVLRSIAAGDGWRRRRSGEHWRIHTQWRRGKHGDKEMMDG